MDSIKLLAEYFGKGGLVMWPLLLCSILVVTIAIERYLFYKETDSGSAFADEYSNLMASGKVQEGQALAESTKGECARILNETMKLNGNNTALASSSARKRVPGRRATSPCRPGSMFSIQATQLR